MPTRLPIALPTNFSGCFADQFTLLWDFFKADSADMAGLRLPYGKLQSFHKLKYRVYTT